MAEVFGVVSGALSIAALFNNIVDCFEYIQLSRHFGRDYERCRLKLDVARLRLSRWGEAIGVNSDSTFAIDKPHDGDSREVQAILEELELLFQAAQKSSKRYEIRARQENLATFKDEDMQEVARGLHNRLGLVARQRQKHTGLVQKVKWALYGGKDLEKLLEQITGFVDDLEKVFPMEIARRRLVELEIEEVSDQPSLLALQDAAATTDSGLSDAATKKLEGITGRNIARDIKTEGSARVLVGNAWTEAALAGGSSVADRTVNTADSIAARGRSAVQIGNQYGSRGIFNV